MSLLTDEARAWATEPFPDHVTVVGRTDIRRYAQAIGETDPIHFDPGAAADAGHPDIVAPPYFPYVIRTHAAHLVERGELTADGSAMADVPPIASTRAMAGETEITVGPPIHAGDTITLRKRIIDVFEKQGRSGDLVFVKTEFTFTNQRDEVVFVERFTRIYR